MTVSAAFDVPNNIQPQENKKRREQTVERAKANHLSRQLQLRLQYARLKVDHGWQKQSLNEVENLYFHHSHQRGPQPYPSPSLIATTQRDATSSVSFSADTPQSSLSFRLGPPISSHSGTPAAPNANTLHPDYINSRPSCTQPQSFNTHNSSCSGLQSPAVSLYLTDTKTLIPMDVDKRTTTPPAHLSAAPIPTNSYHAPRLTSHLSNARNSPLIQDNAPTVPAPQRTDTLRVPQSPAAARNATATFMHGSWSSYPSVSASSPSYNHYPGIPQRQSTATIIADSSTPNGSGSTFAASPSLTYDSFWSAHQNSSRKFSHPAPVPDPPPDHAHSSGIAGDPLKETGEQPEKGENLPT